MKKARDKKKTYTSPRLRVIALETREVMANICKAGGDEMNVGVPMCGIDASCSDLGS
jgi:hypothetical protein